MIKTASFTCNLPFEQFKVCLADYYNNHKISYNEELLEKNAEKLWNKYKEDILLYIERSFAPEVSIDWDSELDTYAGLLKQYIVETKIETQLIPEWSMSFEEYWKDLMMDAFHHNVESLF